MSAPGKALGATSINVGATTGYPTDTGVIISMRTVNTAGTLIAGTHTEWSGTITSGTSVSIEAAPVYGSDQIYAAGSTTQVAIRLSSYAHNKLIDGLLVQHTQTGSHADIITTNTINENTAANGVTIDGLNIKDGALATANSVPNAALAGSIDQAKILTNTLGYAEITTAFATTTTPAAVDVTGLSSTVTVPSGGRRVKVTVFASSINVTGTLPKSIQVNILQDGSIINFIVIDINDAYKRSCTVIGTAVPAAGSHTYKAQISQNTAGTMSMFAGAWYPAFILVELV